LNVADADTGYINNLHVLIKTSTTTGTDEEKRLKETTRSAKMRAIKQQIEQNIASYLKQSHKKNNSNWLEYPLYSQSQRP